MKKNSLHISHMVQTSTTPQYKPSMASETRKRKRSPDELNETHKQHRGAEKDADDTDDSNNKDATNDGLAALLEDSGASAFLQSKFELLLFFAPRIFLDFSRL
jgi:hypothetical protein